jgi:hypothetical protein
MTFRRAIYLGAFMALASVPAQAATQWLYYNFGESIDNAYFVSPNLDGPLGQQFTTQGSAVPTWDLSLSLYSNGGSDAGIVITLNADSGGSPGAELFTIAYLTDDDVVNSYPATFAGISYALSASTAYWIMVSQDTEYQNDTTTLWDVTFSTGDSVHSTSPSSQGNYAFGWPFTPGTSDPLVMSVSYEGQATVETPEPATLIILGAGLAGLGLVNRRRAAKRA